MFRIAKCELENIQLMRYDHLQGDHTGRYGTGIWDNTSRKLKAQLVRETFSGIKGKPILDAGADNGNVIKTLGATGNYGISLDIAFQRLLGNKIQYDGGFVCARAQELPFRNNSLYGISAFDIIEHLLPDDSIRMLQEFYRVLIPGHKLVLATTNTDCLARRLRKIIEPDKKVSIDEHCNEMSYKDLLGIFNLTGFTDVQIIGGSIIPGIRKLQWVLPFSSLYTLDTLLSRKLPKVSSEVFVTAAKPA